MAVPVVNELALMFDACTLPEDTLLVANNVPVVRPVSTMAVPVVNELALMFDACTVPELTLVIANNVPVVNDVVMVFVEDMLVN